MNRNTFIGTSFLASLALTLKPINSLGMGSGEISNAALIGMEDIGFLSNEIRLRDKAYRAFISMHDAALKDGIELRCVSAYRSYKDQLRIWDRKYKSFTDLGISPIESIKKIVAYSTMPGTSRHHWGTDIDLADGMADLPKNLLSPKHFRKNGIFAPFKNWMDANAARFGFYLVYTEDPNRRGFKYEPWHYSFRELSCEYLRLFRDRKIFKTLNKSEISGAKYLSKDFIELYYRENILDINPELL